LIIAQSRDDYPDRETTTPGDVTALWRRSTHSENEQSMSGRVSSVNSAWRPTRSASSTSCSIDWATSIDAVLSEIDTSEGAKADHDAGVLRITANEYETTLAVAAGRAQA
jgi:hypothetical protein